MLNLKKIGFAALLAFSATSANALVLDTFDYGVDNFKIFTTQSGHQIEQPGGTFAAGDSVLNSNINGGTADVFFELASQGGNTTSFGNGLALNNDTSASSVLDITYGELASDGAGGFVNNNSPLPFSAFGDQFYYDIAKLNVGNTAADDLDITIEVTNAAGFTASLTDIFTTDIDVPMTNFISFASFGAADGFFDFITEVNITLTAGNDVDLRITEFGISSVPEPSTIAIFGLALIGFGFSARRKAK